MDAARSYFDTNTGDHQHFFLESEGLLIDIPGESIAVAGVPTPPPGLSVDRVDVVRASSASVGATDGDHQKPLLASHFLILELF